MLWKEELSLLSLYLFFLFNVFLAFTGSFLSDLIGFIFNTLLMFISST